jgi:hypothetical protein
MTEITVRVLDDPWWTPSAGSRAPVGLGRKPMPTDVLPIARWQPPSQFAARLRFGPLPAWVTWDGPSRGEWPPLAR